MQSHIGGNFLGLYLGVITLTNKEIFLEYASKFNSSEKEIKRKISIYLTFLKQRNKIGLQFNTSFQSSIIKSEIPVWIVSA